MKTAQIVYSGTPRSNKVETVTGTVTLKNDGKVSISILNYPKPSYAAKYAFQNLAKEVVAANFIHSAVVEGTLKIVETASKLVKLLFEHTADLKATFIEKTKQSAKARYEYMQNWINKPMVEWYKRFDVTYEERNGGFEPCSIEYNKRNLYKMRDERAKYAAELKVSFDQYEAKEIGYAERHYENSIVKLAQRLNDRGVTDNSDIEINSAKVGVNFECYVYYSGGVVRAWTIIAEGEIQRPHYRYLVK